MMTTPAQGSKKDGSQKSYEQKEAQWKEQISNLHAKLTQAGAHLKALAQENAKLSKRAENDGQTIRLLVSILEKDALEESQAPETVDQEYIKTARTRLHQKKEKESKTRQQDRDTIEALQQRLQNQKSTHEDGTVKEQSVRQSLEVLMKDPENGTFDSSLLPPGLLSTLEDLRSRWVDHIGSGKKHQALLLDTQKEHKRETTRLQLTINSLSEEKEKLASEKEDLEAQLKDAEQKEKESRARVQALEQEHQSLLGKLAHIKETLAPRLEADKQLRQRVGELTSQLEATERELEQTRQSLMQQDEEMSRLLIQKDHEISLLQRQLEQCQLEREEYQVVASENEVKRDQLEKECERLRNELQKTQEDMAKERQERELERTSLSNLQTVLEEFQATKDAEIRAAVEHIERQLEIAKKSWAEYQERARVAEDALEQYQQDVARTQQYERELKEKNLLIGKLRHEAIILNEHLIEAMRRLKEESSENNVDRQLITNLIIGFFMAPRGDRKRFEILTIIASVLQMTDEQKEQIGLLRPNSNKSSKPSTSPGWMSPQQQQQQQQDVETQESFTDAWISFLLKESHAYDNPNKSDPTSSSPKPSLDLKNSST